MTELSKAEKAERFREHVRALGGQLGLNARERAAQRVEEHRQAERERQGSE